jgi:hypothetical protein
MIMVSINKATQFILGNDEGVPGQKPISYNRVLNWVGIFIFQYIPVSTTTGCFNKKKCLRTRFEAINCIIEYVSRSLKGTFLLKHPVQGQKWQSDGRVCGFTAG